MSWIQGARARLHLLFAGRAAESRMSEEVRFHIEMETERLVREEHLAPDEARRRALIAFGGVTRHTEELRDGRGLAWLGGMSLDFKLALRMLVKHPGLTLVSVIGMAVAVAIGAVSFSAIYTLIDGRLPVSEGDRVIAIRNIDRTGNEGRFSHLHDLPVWREALTSVSEIGAYRIVSRNLITLDGHAEPARVAEMTASGFRITRVPPLLGRYFNDEDQRAGAPPVVVIGYSVWQTRFTARPDIIGQVIQIGDARHTIIGVMPDGYGFPVNNRVWSPLRLDPANYERGRAPSIDVFARLAPGATIEDVRRQLETVGKRLAADFPRTHAEIRPRVVPYTRAFIDNPDMMWTYHLIQAMITMLLVVIGTNVAILVYARTAARMGEIAVRTALGASRGRVVAQLFAEAFALSSLATVAGLAFAYLALQTIDATLVRLLGEQVPYWIRMRVTPGVLAYAVGLAVLAAVIVGVLPGLKATGRGVRANLQHLSAGGSGMRLGKSWTFLVIAQITVAVAVLPVAIAGINAWRRIESAKAKDAMKHIVTSTLSLDHVEMPGRVDGDTTFASRYRTLRGVLAERLRAEPGVTDVMFASSAPGGEDAIRIGTDSSTAMAGVTDVDLDYFRVFGISLLAGRSFEPGDAAPAANTVIVNRSFVTKVFGAGVNPVGLRIRRPAPDPRPGQPQPVPSEWETVVGVVPDFPVDSSASAPKIYRPLSVDDTMPVMMAVRVKGLTADEFTNRLRELTVATNPMLRIEGIKSLSQALYDASSDTRLFILIVELVTGATILLSSAGIYALMAFTITRRRREIGIRAALGAGPRRLLAGVLSRVMVQIAIGIAIGVVIAGAIDRAMEGGWTGRRGSLGLATVAAFMAGVALLAAIGPARRALLIQPTEALRSE